MLKKPNYFELYPKRKIICGLIYPKAKEGVEADAGPKRDDKLNPNASTESELPIDDAVREESELEEEDVIRDEPVVSADNDMREASDQEEEDNFEDCEKENIDVDKGLIDVDKEPLPHAVTESDELAVSDQVKGKEVRVDEIDHGGPNANF